MYLPLFFHLLCLSALFVSPSASVNISSAPIMRIAHYFLFAAPLFTVRLSFRYSTHFTSVNICFALLIRCKPFIPYKPIIHFSQRSLTLLFVFLYFAALPSFILFSPVLRNQIVFYFRYVVLPRVPIFPIFPLPLRIAQFSRYPTSTCLSFGSLTARSPSCNVCRKLIFVIR